MRVPHCLHTGRSIATLEGNHECPRGDREPSFPLNNNSPFADIEATVDIPLCLFGPRQSSKRAVGPRHSPALPIGAVPISATERGTIRRTGRLFEMKEAAN